MGIEPKSSDADNTCNDKYFFLQILTNHHDNMSCLYNHPSTLCYTLVCLNIVPVMSQQFLLDNQHPYLLSEPECWACCCELEECGCFAEDHKALKWIDKTPNDPSDSLPNLIEQSDSDCETSDQPL